MHNALQDATQTKHDAIDTVWRLEAAKVIGTVARLAHDVGASEKLAADAPVAALEQWRQDGVPTNPGAWLTTTAKRRALDWLRHPSMAAAEHEALARVQWLRAAKLTRNACERELLLECAHNTPPEGGIHECPCRWFCGEAQAPH